MLLQAREDLGIKGSFAQSTNGNVTIKGKNVTIEAASQTLTQSSNDSVHQYTKTLASTAPVQDELGSFKNNQAQSKTTQTTYLLSGVKAENGTVKIVSEGDILVAGAEIIGNNIEIAAMKGNLTVKSLQDVLEYRQGSQGIQVGQTNGFSVSEATKSSLWVNTQTKIVGTNSVALKAGTLNNDGALIANITKDGIDGGNLSVIADQIIYNTLQDRNKASNYGISVGVSGAGSPPQSANGSTTIGASYSGLNQAQSTQATIGNGTIQTGSSLAGLNRDIGVTQKMTKDQKTGGLNVNLTIDNAVFADPLKYFAPIVELPQNAVKAGQRVGDAANDLTDSIMKGIAGDAKVGGVFGIAKDYQKQTAIREATLKFQAANPGMAEIINNNKTYTADEMKVALQTYTNFLQTEFKNKGIEVNVYDGNKIVGNSAAQVVAALASGMSEGTQIYYNIGTAGVNTTKTNEFIFVIGHENGHADGSNESIADRRGDQTLKAWTSENRYNGNTLGGGYTNMRDFYTTQSQSLSVLQGTQQAGLVQNPQYLLKSISLPSLDKVSGKIIQKEFLLDEKAADNFRNFITSARQEGLAVNVNNTFRINPSTMINTNNTKASGLSRHQAGLAVDLNGVRNLSASELSLLNSIARKNNISPLANQKNDLPHFDIDPKVVGYNNLQQAVAENRGDYVSRFSRYKLQE